MLRATAFALAIAGILPLMWTAADAAELVMFRKDGCPWCAAWEREVGPAYPKTAEGQRAPLRRIDIGAPRPEGLQLDKPVVFTPTFVLAESGQEVGRITGYPGEASFWALLEDLLDELDRRTGSEDSSS